MAATLALEPGIDGSGLRPAPDWSLGALGGALVYAHADPMSLAHLAAAGPHTVLMPVSAL